MKFLFFLFIFSLVNNQSAWSKKSLNQASKNNHINIYQQNIGNCEDRCEESYVVCLTNLCDDFRNSVIEYKRCQRAVRYTYLSQDGECWNACDQLVNPYLHQCMIGLLPSIHHDPFAVSFIPYPFEINYPKIGQLGFQGYPIVHDIETDSKGNILILSEVVSEHSPHYQIERQTKGHILITKLKKYGGLDLSFGDQGYLIIPHTEEKLFTAKDMVLDQEDQIYLVGSVGIPIEEFGLIKSRWQMAIWKISSQGEINPDFSNNIDNGSYLLHPEHSMGISITIDRNQEIISAGNQIFWLNEQAQNENRSQGQILWKINTTGENVADFGVRASNHNHFIHGPIIENFNPETVGPVITVGQIIKIRIDEENKILVLAKAEVADLEIIGAGPEPVNAYLVRRFLANGNLDTSFGHPLLPPREGRSSTRDLFGLVHHFGEKINDFKIFNQDFYLNATPANHNSPDDYPHLARVIKLNEHGDDDREFRWGMTEYWPFANNRFSTKENSLEIIDGNIYPIFKTTLGLVDQNENLEQLCIAKIQWAGNFDFTFSEDRNYYQCFSPDWGDSFNDYQIYRTTQDSQKNIYGIALLEPNLAGERKRNSYGVFRFKAPHYHELELIFVEPNSQQ